MTINEARFIVDQLSLVKGFPTKGPALELLAEKLVQWCRGTESATSLDQAAWLVSEVAELNEYPGPGALHKMLEDHFYPAAATVAYHGPEPVDIECQFCRDKGTVEDAQGLSAWCSCDAAEEMRRDLPEWLDTLNLCRARKPRKKKEFLSAAQFEGRIGA